MEVLKVRKSNVFQISIYFFIFIGAVMGFLMYLSMHPEIASRSSTMEIKTSFLEGSDWNSFLSLLIQIVLTVGVIGSGIITSWSFGREFAEHVIKDLLALPVSRSAIVSSKFIVLFVWSILLMIVALAAALLTGVLIRLPGWPEVDFPAFLISYLMCTILNTLLITPVAFVASTGRGFILPISFVILILILTQFLFIGIPGSSIWFPWALPALYSGVAEEIAPSANVVSWLLYFLVVLSGLLGTIWWWRYADHK
jgi:ABC-2 type transport system permease protein